MRITIDPKRRTGHGLCFGVAPSLFFDDERGYGQVRGSGEVVPPRLQGEAKAAIQCCPEGAIGWVDGPPRPPSTSH